jgi:hypothetical protein
MAKKKPTDQNAAIDALFGSIHDNLGGMSPQEFADSVRGVPIPTFAERYIRDGDMYLTGKIEQYVGGYASGKTSYGEHVGSTFLDNGGYFIIIETENKFSHLTLEANIGSERYNCGRLRIIEAGSMYTAKDDKDVEACMRSWQTSLFNIIDGIRAGGIQKPFYILVDSILGAAGAEVQAEVDETGQTQGRSTSGLAQAASLSRFFSAFSPKLRGLPVLVGFTNHGKDKVDMGMPTRGDKRTFPGGNGPKFASSLVLWFTRLGAEVSVETAGRDIEIGVYKNSFGDESRKISLGFQYNNLFDEAGQVILDEEGNPKRRVKWDWTDASGRLLESAFIEKKLLSADAREVLDIVSPRANRFTSKELGINDATHAELGAAFEANPEVMRKARLIPKLGFQSFKKLKCLEEAQ